MLKSVMERLLPVLLLAAVAGCVNMPAPTITWGEDVKIPVVMVDEPTEYHPDRDDMELTVEKAEHCRGMLLRFYVNPHSEIDYVSFGVLNPAGQLVGRGRTNSFGKVALDYGVYDELTLVFRASSLLRSWHYGGVLPKLRLGYYMPNRSPLWGTRAKDVLPVRRQRFHEAGGRRHCR